MADGSLAILPDGCDADGWQALLSSGGGCREQGVDPGPSTASDMVVAITTRTAFSIDLGAIYSRALVRRGWLGAERENDLTVALREALANALVHGNLDVTSEEQSTPEGFVAQAMVMEARLADPAFGNRVLTLKGTVVDGVLEINVQDQGRGFQPRDTSAAVQRRIGGHGLELMRSRSDGVRIEDCGRRAVLLYRPTERPPG